MCIQAIASTYTMCIQALASTYTMCIQALPKKIAQKTRKFVKIWFQDKTLSTKKY